ncbi:MAG TPA: 50S ribosomal protein L11 methyltransferase [Solirubrobacteraceae bacterium]|nr:50S ribosomal protein L11 methyltransferase [Solirubrobacteraceae bacterium]
MIRLALRVRRADAELVLAELLALAPAGCEERDVDAETVELALYGAPGELPALPPLQAAVGSALVSVSSSEVREDWAERWRQFHRPVLIRTPPTEAAGAAWSGRSLYVRPPWEQATGAQAGRIELVIDPGQAFGTGAHPTTRLALELLLAACNQAQKGAALDIGTGSGVLAIAARALGRAPVLAIDNDPRALAAAAANAARSGVAIELERCDIRSEQLPLPESREGSLLILANLLRPLLLELVERIELRAATLILSGLLDEEADEVAERYAARLGASLRERSSADGWSALLLTVP